MCIIEEKVQQKRMKMSLRLLSVSISLCLAIARSSCMYISTRALVHARVHFPDQLAFNLFGHTDETHNVKHLKFLEAEFWSKLELMQC